jgi:hypothetical protein
VLAHVARSCTRWACGSWPPTQCCGWPALGSACQSACLRSLQGWGW